MSELPKGWEDAALEAADMDMSSNESPRQFAKLIAIRTANRLAQLQAKRKRVYLEDLLSEDYHQRRVWNVEEAE